MVWAPNVGITYPFGEPIPPASLPYLDTNNDGVVNGLDDPYLPYYPGDQYVDWVGLSLYYYPESNSAANSVPAASYFQDNMVGSGPNIQYLNNQVLQNGGLHNFYSRFAEARKKPLMLPETAAPWVSAWSSASTTETIVKENWWQQIFTAYQTKFPLLKLVVFFEEQKVDATTGLSNIRDWRIMSNPEVRNAFIKDQAAGGTMFAHATDIKFNCKGEVNWN